MGINTTILSENSSRIKENRLFQQLVTNSTSSFHVAPDKDRLITAVKQPSQSKQTYENIRMTAGSIARYLSKRNIEKAEVTVEVLTTLYGSLDKSAVITAFTEGWNLGNYQFLNYKSERQEQRSRLTIVGDGFTKNHIKTGEIRAEATAFSRNLMNETPSALNPETFPALLQNAFKNTDVSVTVYDKEELERREMNGILTVGKGSKHDPAFVELSYQKDKSKPLVTLVGKGVTFDTGGMSLKRGKDLSLMRMDMGGAAAVSGAMKLLEAIQADVNVIALIPIAENILDGTSVISGDVITYKNGLTVQVGNTDAEGRLILADALIRAGELESDYIVDIATLTGSILNALGTKLAGVFGDEELAIKMKKIGDTNGDFNWPMPLVDAYESYLDSDYADFNNTSSKTEGGSIVASLFLRRFVPESAKWLHIDMAGMMSSEEYGYYAKSATGYGVRLLADFAEHVSK
jgi:leucyl aminopeptidase